MHGPQPLLLLLIAWPAFCLATTSVPVTDVVPTQRDRTHLVWMHGPTHSGKIGGNWPSFYEASGDTSGQCTTFDDEFTGYQSNGQYCQTSSSELDEIPHLLLSSGNIGMVMDAHGLSYDVRYGWDRKSQLHIMAWHEMTLCEI